MFNPKTVNRGWLKRKVEAGKVVAVSCYSYDDMSGSERSSFKEMPVRIRDGDWKPGFLSLFESDFRTKSGCAYHNPNGTITLIVHSNCNYTFKVA